MYQMSGRGIQFIKNRDFWLFLFKDKWARFSTQIVTHTLLVINDDKRILWQPHSADKSHFLLDSSKQVNINASWREKLFHGNYPILRITSEEDQNCELKCLWVSCLDLTLYECDFTTFYRTFVTWKFRSDVCREQMNGYSFLPLRKPEFIEHTTHYEARVCICKWLI